MSMQELAQGRMNATPLAAPVLILMILAMMVLPLPPFVLDLLLHLQHRACR